MPTTAAGMKNLVCRVCQKGFSKAEHLRVVTLHSHILVGTLLIAPVTRGMNVAVRNRFSVLPSQLLLDYMIEIACA